MSEQKAPPELPALLSQSKSRSLVEAVGLVILTLSLLLVAYELYHSRQLALAERLTTGAEVEASVRDLVVNMQLTVVNNSHLAEMMATVDAAESIKVGIQSLSNADQIRYLRYYMAVWNQLDANVYLYESELMDDEQLEHSIKSNIRYFNPYWQALGIVRRLARPGVKKIIEESLTDVNMG